VRQTAKKVPAACAAGEGGLVEESSTHATIRHLVQQNRVIISRALSCSGDPAQRLQPSFCGRPFVTALPTHETGGGGAMPLLESHRDSRLRVLSGPKRIRRSGVVLGPLYGKRL